MKRHRRPKLRRAAGFSLVEALVATALLLLIAVGVLPLFSSAIESNLQGNDALRESTAAGDGAEDLSAVRFSAEPITFTTAATEDTGAWAYQLLDDSEWVDTIPSGGTAQISRRVVLRQYQIQLDGNIAVVPGTADRGSVHMKEVELQIGNARRGRPIDRVAYSLALRKAL